MDIAPTCFEVAGASYPVEKEGRTLYPPRGESLWEFLKGNIDEMHGTDYVFALEHGGRTMLRKGNWKVVSENWKEDTTAFQLYNLAADRAEKKDLMGMEAEKYSELMKEWGAFAEEIELRNSDQ